MWLRLPPGGILDLKRICWCGGCRDCRVSGLCLLWGQLGAELKREPRMEKGEKEDWEEVEGGERERRRVIQETGVMLILSDN